MIVFFGKNLIHEKEFLEETQKKIKKSLLIQNALFILVEERCLYALNFCK